MATLSEVARHLFMAPTDLNFHISKGTWIDRRPRGGYDIDKCREAYIMWVRARLKRGRSAEMSEDGAGSLTDERARKERAMAEKIEMQNARTRGDLIEAEAVEAGMQAMIFRCKARLRAIPSRLAPLIQGEIDLAEINAIASRMIDEALQELALETFNPDGGGDEPGDGSLGATAEPDGQRVG